MEIVKDAWESFERRVVADDAPPIQRQEMRRAFYAGAWAVLITCETISAPDISQEQAVAILASCRKECERFVALMNMGRA
jgi:hypothetical protein